MRTRSSEELWLHPLLGSDRRRAPDRRIGIVLLSNSENFESVAPALVAAAIGDEYSPFDWLGYEPYDPARRKPAPPRLVAIQVAPEVLVQYAGEYRLGQATVHVKVDGGRLYASDDGRSWDELSAKAETVFFFKGRTVTVTFVKDARGRVVRLDVDDAGTRFSAQRIR